MAGHNTNADEVLQCDSTPYKSNLASTKSSGECLWKGIGEPTKPKGLIVITGSTGSGKTRILNSLLYQILKLELARPRKANDPIPHIVAIGDPVETWLYDTESNRRTPHEIVEYQRECPNLVVRFTARTIGRDVDSVNSATIDALRQTPTSFIISELRKDEEFRSALEFAGTGHLVLATAHATSLVDAMARLMKVEKVNSSSGRALLAQRLAAVVFLRPYKFDGSNGKVPIPSYEVTLPRVWRANPNGCRAFVSDGLSSLHVAGPDRSSTKMKSRQGQEAAIHGYYASATLLKNVAQQPEDEIRWNHLVQMAHRWDLFQDQD